jgi:hypothetical protein
MESWLGMRRRLGLLPWRKFLCRIGFHSWFDGRGNGLPIHCRFCFLTLSGEYLETGGC